MLRWLNQFSQFRRTIRDRSHSCILPLTGMAPTHAFIYLFFFFFVFFRKGRASLVQQGRSAIFRRWLSNLRISFADWTHLVSLIRDWSHSCISSLTGMAPTHAFIYFFFVFFRQGRACLVQQGRSAIFRRWLSNLLISFADWTHLVSLIRDWSHSCIS